MDFFGMPLIGNKKRVSDGQWAARARLAAWFSREYRIAQLQVGVFRFKRILDSKKTEKGPPNLTYDLQTLPVGITGVTVRVKDVLTSQVGVGALLDQHINAPGNVLPNLRTALAVRPGRYSQNSLDPEGVMLLVFDYIYARKMTAAGPRGGYILAQSHLDFVAGSFVRPGGDSGWLWP
jgi:hypothetical protein